uniref:Carboxypeptidase n=1 Tax=Panagrolaimus sp. JU765 TaxID=591449 RepID=A0AC34RP06_9BILA
MFWFNGGPGCSSLFGLLIELGPYFVNDDGETLRENPNSWNKFASVVFIESTYGVGYSFNPDDDDKTNDDTRAAKEHSAAIQHFFKLHPKFRSHPTYIFGESYGGIYVPMMAVELIHANADINLKGIGIGNGAVNREINVETTMPFLYHHGFIDERIWQDIQSECCGSGYCNYTTPGRCQELKDLVWEANYGNINAYDIIRDCEISEERSQFDLDGVWHEQLKKRSSQKTSNTSTDDDVNSLQCFNEHALRKYLNDDQVRKALHIPENIVKTWSDCSSSVYDAYYRGDIEMSSYVKKLINSDVKVLMYYGDTDYVCNFMMGQKFAHQLGLPLLKQKSPWFYNKQVAGTSTQKLIEYQAGNFTMDEVAVRILKEPPPENVDPACKILCGICRWWPIHVPACISCVACIAGQCIDTHGEILQLVQSHPDEIKSLPGLNFDINFKHYSGFLNASETRVLHYWFVESQNDPEKDPLMFWFNGGPGCSSLLGLLTELGPYFVNDDGVTLRKNPNSWNKFASIVFLESPYGVGYSYKTGEEDTSSSDDISAKENYAAIQHFFELHPKFKNHPTYIFGESYAGIYVPMLALEIIEGSTPINLQGIGIGNGLVKSDIDTVFPFYYWHGMIDESNWQGLQSACCGSYANACNYSSDGECQEWKWKSLAQLRGINIYDIIRDCAMSTERMNADLSYIWPKMKMNEMRNDNDDDDLVNVPEFVKKIVDVGVKVLLYYGDTDAVCNFLMGQTFANELGLPLWKKKSPWFYNKQVAGFSTVYEGLTFLTVKDVGHMAPQWKPAETAYAVEEFLRYPFKTEI